MADKLEKLRWELVQENSAFVQSLLQQQERQQQLTMQKFQDQLNYIVDRLCGAGNECEAFGASEDASPAMSYQPSPGPETPWTPGTSLDNNPGCLSMTVHASMARPISPGDNQEPNSWREMLTFKRASKELSVGMELCRCHIGHAFAILERSRKFQVLIQLLVCSSGIMLGIQADRRAVNLDTPGVNHTLTVVDFLFTGTFCLELLIRCMAHGLFFFSPQNPDVSWNIFDSLVVLADVVEKGLEFALETTVLSLSTGRLLRMMRFVRLIRVLRVLRFFQDLRVMILSILGSMRPLLFAILLLGIIIYTVAVALLHFVTDELIRLADRGQQDTTSFKALSRSFGSLGKATYTLFLSISGGEDWGEVSHPLWEISPLLGSFFLLYVCFAMFCVLNIITGIFIEEANAKTCQDEDHMLVRELDKRRRFIAEAKKFFERADKDGSGQLTWPEFQEILENVRMQKLLERLGIDVQACGARNVFEMFDFDGNGVIEVTEFTSGLKRLRGGARSIEIAGMRFEQQKLLSEVASLTRTCAEILHSCQPTGQCTAGPDKVQASYVADSKKKAQPRKSAL